MHLEWEFCHFFHCSFADSSCCRKYDILGPCTSSTDLMFIFAKMITVHLISPTTYNAFAGSRDCSSNEEAFVFYHIAFRNRSNQRTVGFHSRLDCHSLAKVIMSLGLCLETCTDDGHDFCSTSFRAKRIIKSCELTSTAESSQFHWPRNDLIRSVKRRQLSSR